ncbi:transposase IS66 [Agrobacterium tumefaciens]|nr:transposase IS66 [Agrobacterium tumefaciens]
MPVRDVLKPTGSDRGADRAPFMATLIMSAKLNDIDPQMLLADVIARDLPLRISSRMD